MSGRKGPASSPLVIGGKVLLQQNTLTAFDADTGVEAWNNPEVTGSNSSPASWNDIIICNSQKEVIGVELASGKTLWKAPGGGEGTPVV